MKKGVAVIQFTNGEQAVIRSRADIWDESIQLLLEQASIARAPLLDITCSRPGFSVWLYAARLPVSGAAKRRFTIRCGAMSQHSGACPCPHLDSSEDGESDSIYSACMFDEHSKIQVRQSSAGKSDAGIPRRGFGSFCEQLRGEGYYEAFWNGIGTNLRLLKSTTPTAENFFHAVRNRVGEPVFSFGLKFAEVVARADREFAVVLLDAPLHEVWPRMGVSGALALRWNSQWEIAASSRAARTEWCLPTRILEKSNGRARHENGFRRPPYFAVLVGRPGLGRIECEHCYLHPVAIGTPSFATIASNEEGAWLKQLPRAQDDALYKPVSGSDFNNTMARVLAGFGYGWDPQDLLPDALQISERGVLVREFKGREDLEYLRHFETKVGKWKILKRSIPVLSFDWAE